jgi:putative ABC transport system permease protein
VVGVVADVEHTIISNRGSRATLYLPLAQQPLRNLGLTLRTAGDPGELAASLPRAIAGHDAGLVVAQVQTLEDFEAQFFVGMRVLTTILVAFGSLALLLAALGTYGVLSYSVARRSHEIGVRMAVGARPGAVMTLIARQGLLLASVGIALGIPGVMLVTRAVNQAMGDFVALQPDIVVAIGALLALVTLLASWVPARRAARLDPVLALRAA